MPTPCPSLRAFPTTAVLCGFLLALALSPGALTAQEESGDWFAEAMAREAELGEETEITTPDGSITIRVPAAPLGEPQFDEDSWLVQLDIGTEMPMECWLFTDILDAAAAMVALSEALFEVTEQNNGTVTEREIHHLDVGHFSGAPYLALEWLYLVGEPPNASIGQWKNRLAVTGQSGVFCTHSELGYRDTFARIFEHLTRSVTYSSQSAEPYYEELALVAVNGQRIGFDRALFLPVEGGTRIERTAASLIPIDGSTVGTEDSTTVTFSYPDGSLINEVSAELENGELTQMLELDPGEKAGSWLVSGTYRGKEIEASFTDEEAPITLLGEILWIRGAIARGEAGATTTAKLYEPSSDPTRLTEVSLTLDESAATGSSDDVGATLALGPIEVRARLDRSGSARTAEVPTGAARVVIERVWQRGAVPDAPRDDPADGEAPAQAPTETTIGLYLHVTEVTASSPTDFARTPQLRLALYVEDTEGLARNVGETSLTDIEVAGDRVSATVAPSATFVGAPAPAHQAASFVIDFEEPIFEPLLTELAEKYGERPAIAELTAFTDQAIPGKSSRRGFDLGSQVARSREGDCTEHAVLLTSLARATGYPARVVFGNVLTEHDGVVAAFGHAWSEIHDGERWRIADAALLGIDEEAIELRYLPTALLVDEGPGFSMGMVEQMAQIPRRIEILPGD